MRCSGTEMAQTKIPTPKIGTSKNNKLQNFPTVVLRASKVLAPLVSGSTAAGLVSYLACHLCLLAPDYSCGL